MCGAEWPRVSVALAVPRLRYAGAFSISTVDLNGSLSAHEFTQPCYPVHFFLHQSGVGSQLEVHGNDLLKCKGRGNALS